MGTTIRTLIAMLAGVMPALAAKGNGSEDGGLLLMAFLGFGAMIITFQFIPAVVLFASMLKGLFMSAPEAKDSNKS